MKLLPPLIIATIALLPGRAAFGQTKPPETRSASPAAKPGAVGFVLEKQGEEFEVKALAPGTPAAAQQKIQPGDYLVSVSQGGGPAVPVRDKDMAAVTALIRGPEGSTVGISAVHPGEDEGRAKMRQLVRAPIELIASASDSALKPGEAAPELTGVFWIKGEPVTKFARDKVYLVE